MRAVVPSTEPTRIAFVRLDMVMIFFFFFFFGEDKVNLMLMIVFQCE